MSPAMMRVKRIAHSKHQVNDTGSKVTGMAIGTLPCDVGSQSKAVVSEVFVWHNPPSLVSYLPGSSDANAKNFLFWSGQEPRS